MADNVTIPTTGTGTATPVIATDDVASVHYQKIKIALGADGAIDTLLDSGQQLAANSVPVVIASDQGDIKITLDGEGVTISGTVQVQSNSANLATEVTAAAIQAAVELLDTAVSEGAINVGITAGGPLGFAAEPEATGDGNIIGILKRLRTLLSGTLTATISGTVAVTQSGTWDEVGINDSGNSLTVDAPVGTPVFVRLSDGTSAITTLPVSLASVPSHAVTNAGTFAVQESGAALTALQLIDNLVLAEDAVHSSGDPGVQALAVRKDSGAAIAGTDGDYSPLQVDSSGNLRVNIAAGGAGDGAILDGVSSSIKATVLDYTNSNPLAVRLTDTAGDYVGAGAGTQYTEDAAAAANPVGTALILVRDDSLAGSLTTANGDNVAARGNDKGEQYTKDTDAAALLTTIDTSTGATSVSADALARALVSDGRETLGVQLAAGANNIGGVDVLSIAAGDNNIGNVDIVTVPAPLSTTGGGTEATALRVTIASDSTGVMSVDDNGGSLTIDAPVGTPAFVRLSDGAAAITTLPVSLASVPSHAVTNAGTFAVQAAAAGDVANDGADSGNPVKVGSVAYNFDGSAPGTAVAEGDRVNQIADVYGRQYVETTHPNYWTASADYASAQTNASIKAAPGAGLKLYITDVIISNGATAGNVTLLDGSGGTVKLELYPGINGGLAHSFRTPIALTANTALCITSTTVTTHSVTICGYTAP